VLIDVLERGIHIPDAGVGLRRRLVRLVCAVAGFDCVAVGFRDLRVCEAETFGRARIDVLDVAAVRGSEFIEFVHAAYDRRQLAADILLAREWVQLAPEALFALQLERLAAGVGRGRGRLRRGRGLAGSLSRGLGRTLALTLTLALALGFRLLVDF